MKKYIISIYDEIQEELHHDIIEALTPNEAITKFVINTFPDDSDDSNDDWLSFFRSASDDINKLLLELKEVSLTCLYTEIK